MKQKVRLLSVGFGALILSVMLAMTAFAGEEVKIKGTIIAADADPNRNLAPIAIQCEDALYAVEAGGVAKKMLKWVGHKAKVQGVVKEIEVEKEIEGEKVIEVKKVITPWVFWRQE